MRKFLASALLALSRRTLRKHNTKLIILYGWDWTEVLRESVYDLLSEDVNIRRNSAWIRWDLGLPLFVMGYDYSPQQSKLRLCWHVFKACLRNLWPRQHKHILVVSLYAKNASTLDYWLALSEIEAIVLLPERIELPNKSESLTKIIRDQTEAKKIKLLDLSANTAPKMIAGIEKLNPLQLKLFSLLSQVNDKVLNTNGFSYDTSDLMYAILKVDWQNYILSRIKTNLIADIAHEITD